MKKAAVVVYDRFYYTDLKKWIDLMQTDTYTLFAASLAPCRSRGGRHVLRPQAPFSAFDPQLYDRVLVPEGKCTDEEKPDPAVVEFLLQAEAQNVPIYAPLPFRMCLRDYI